MKMTEINLKDENIIPQGQYLAVIERSDFYKDDCDQALILYGWDEVGAFNSEFKDPIYVFIS
jgi:hypothetical protein